VEALQPPRRAVRARLVVQHPDRLEQPVLVRPSAEAELLPQEAAVVLPIRMVHPCIENTK